MGHWDYYPPYVSVAEKKARAMRKLAQLKKKDPDIRPVSVEGRTLARTWWGKAWNKNLESYADYSNRIGRGRSYVRNGMVLDLRISSGTVTALVQGTSSRPYKIAITIKPLKKEVREKIKNACSGKLTSLPELMKGKFPKALGEIFTTPGTGLFPSPREISFSCSCPDAARMCKHVAAALYAIGTRLDDGPHLFFTLRNLDVNELITQTVQDTSRQLLEKSKTKSHRVLDETNMEALFGIELDSRQDLNKLEGTLPPKTSGTRASGKKMKKIVKPAEHVPLQKQKKATRSVRKKDTLEHTGTTKQQIRKKTKKTTNTELVLRLIQKSRRGTSISGLAQKSGLTEQQVYQIVYRLKKKNIIVDTGKGLFRGTS